MMKKSADDNKALGKVTVLPAKSDSDVIFCLQSYEGFIIDRINTQVIYRFTLAQVECTT